MYRDLFIKERLPHKLVTVGDEALTTADRVFSKIVGVPVREMRLLRIIDDTPGITFVELVTATTLERSLVSRIIQKLLGRGLIERRPSPDDARRYRLFTNEKGKLARKNARELSNRLEEIVLSPLSRAEIAQINKAMLTLMDWLGTEAYQTMLAECDAAWSRPADSGKSKKAS